MVGQPGGEPATAPGRLTAPGSGPRRTLPLLGVHRGQARRGSVAPTGFTPSSRPLRPVPHTNRRSCYLEVIGK